jgi:hypothetical protein
MWSKSDVIEALKDKSKIVFFENNVVHFVGKDGTIHFNSYERMGSSNDFSKIKIYQEISKE